MPRKPFTPAFPAGFFSSSEIRAWDARAIEEFGVPGVVLMENAGRHASEWILAWAQEGKLSAPFHIYCGPGNNGGDGFVVARHLANHLQETHVTLVGGDRSETESDAAVHREIARRMGIPFVATAQSPTSANRPTCGTVVDALFGTGLSRPIGSPFREWIEMLTDTALPVVALDIPSGLDAELPKTHGTSLRAQWTVTFAARKTSFDTPLGQDLCGHVEVADIGMPRSIWDHSFDASKFGRDSAAR